ncbi:hypothetical protein F5888DRAFT_1926975 [Russula emetica]|nr:hypothetical protein F5888DRAFT_1926975 [Russula emetica]
MAEALSTVVDYTKAMRERPIKRALKVLARKKDVKRILIPHRMDTLTNEDTLLSLSRNPAFERRDSSSATPAGEKLIRETSDNLDAIREVDYQADDSALAPQVETAKEKSKDPAPPEAGSKDESKVSPDLTPGKLREWLAPPEHITAHEAAHPETGVWFVRGKAFRWWKNKEKGASLLIWGEPGSGKTILCSSIIQEVNRTRNKSEITACYYFDSKNPKKRNLWGLLASLVTQLYESSKRHPKSMPTLYTKFRNSSDPPSEVELTQLLNDFLAELKAQFSIYIVIDGVDNCMETGSTESPKVLKFLEDLVRSRHSKLYICITSSLMEGMEKSLKQMAAGASSRRVVLHDEDGQKKDIKTYITAFVRNNMQTLPDKDKEDVIKTLSERAGGRFGWISHQLHALGGNTLSQTSEILEEVGTPRDEEFAQALHDIPKEKIQYSVDLFQCLVAAIRPLSLKELANISAELDSNADPHEDAVLSAYPTLIARDKDDPTIIQFSHESLKEFLTSNRLRTSRIENSSRYHFSLEAAHATLARVCINVLLRFDETADITHLKKRSPLALYAAQYWVQHTKQGNAATGNQGVMESMERLFDPSKSHLEAWIWMHDVDKGQSRTMEDIEERPSQRGGTPLYYAALCGFTELVRHLANLRPEDLHDSHGYYGTPLHAASFKGHNDAVLALLETDPKMMDKKVDNKTPLHAAYCGGQLKIMELLLDKGADVEATGALDSTLLHCASLHGRLDVVELLLKNEADVNSKNKNGWTPLHRAALRGQVKVAEHLLNFKLKDENGENPKVAVDVNAQSHNKNTPLHVASIAGKLQIVELLLRHNAKREIKGEYGWTPREAANKNRHEKIAERVSRGSESWWGGSDLRRGFDMLRRYANSGSG